MKPLLGGTVLLCVHICIVDSYEVDNLAILEKSLDYLNFKNGIQLESIVIISDQQNTKCDKSLNTNFYLESPSFLQGKLVSHLTSNVTRNILEKVLRKTQSTIVFVFDFHCSRGVQEAILRLPTIHFVQNIFLFIQPSNDMVENRLKDHFDLNWQAEFSMIQSQIYIFNGNSENGSIFELYKPCSDHSMIIRKLITFSQGITQVLHKALIWERRKNLSGCNLKVTYINTDHFYESKTSNDTTTSIAKTNQIPTNRSPEVVVQSNGKTFYGLERKVFNTLHSTLNFSIIWVHTKDNKFGAVDNTSGEWNGIVRTLANRDADMSLIWLTVTTLRGEVLNYTQPIYFGSYKLYLQKPDSSTSWSTYVSVFYIDYWIVFIVVFFVLSMHLFCVFSLADKYSNINRNRNKSWIRTILSGFSATSLGVAAQDVYLAYNISYNTIKSTRGLLLVACLFGMLNYYVYNGALISSLMVPKYDFPIQELSDFLKNPKYKLLVPGNGAERMYLEDSYDPQHRKLWAKSLSEGGNAYELKEAESIIKQDSHKILFGPSPEFEMIYESFPCEIMTTGFSYGYRQLAFPFKKNSPLLNLFNYHIGKILESGLERLQDTIDMRGKRKCRSEKDQKFRAFSYKDVISVFVFSGVGCITAILYCFIEWVYYRYFVN